MNLITSLYLLLFLIMTPQEHSNHLIHETSPYLLQHAHNPVDWYPWGEEALKKAQLENKLILVSIGYSACHWCHVMERESFENEEVAKLMNEYFICIKVDREERPDVDQIYMNAVHLMRGQGGWPLNCFAMPDGRPVFGGTYFPKEQWMHTLKTLHLSFLEDPLKFEEYAENLLKGIQKSELIDVQTNTSIFSKDDLDQVYQQMAGGFDRQKGGFGGAPKFPLPIGLEFVLAYGQLNQQKKALEFVELTLDEMAKGGIYDQIGGGFARYSVDNEWLAPHFEKMLYDNAQLVSLYSKAYQITKNPLYKHVVIQTLDFVKRELTQNEGGFYSALDADSEGEEGKYYVWSKTEVQQLLGADAELFCEAFDITEKGNWEGKNILRIKKSHLYLSNKFNIPEKEMEDKLAHLSTTLLQARNKRIRPGLDDKILCSWNALMMQAYIDAYKAFGDQEYLETAKKSANFLWAKLSDQNGKLHRTYKNGHAKIDGFLEDYAFLIKAYTSLYQVSLNEKFLQRAESLMKYSVEHFLHQGSMMFYYAEEDENLVARKMESSDNVIPAANSVMAHNLLDLASLTENKEFVRHAEIMLKNMQNSLKKGQVYYANWDLLLMRFTSPSQEVVVMGENAADYVKELQYDWSFNTIYAGGVKETKNPLTKDRYVEGKTLIYVCENQVCQYPVATVNEAKKLIGSQL